MAHNFERARLLERKVITSTLNIDNAKTEQERLENTTTALVHALALVVEYEDIFKALANNFDNALEEVADLVKIAKS